MTGQEQLSNEEFLERLARLFESSDKAHSVFVSHKRITLGPEASSSSSPADAHTIVVRATDGKGKAASGRTKFTTHVDAAELPTFQTAYSALLRSSTAAFLRKRDKAKERKVDKMLKEKRKKMDDTQTKGKLSLVGAKRGAGRRKRQQAQKKAAQLRRERKRTAQTAVGKALGGGGGGGASAQPVS